MIKKPISYFTVWIHLKWRSHSTKTKLPEHYMKTSMELLPDENTTHGKIGYDFLGIKSPLLAGTCYYPVVPIICINPEWAFHILNVGYNDDVKNALMITIGHEMTHRKNYRRVSNLFKYKGFSQKNPARFLCHVVEVNCDFGAAQKMADCSQQHLIDSMNYKLKYRKSQGMDDNAGIAHPSWAKRIKYAETGRFDESLIRQIAKDTGCKNERLIRDVCDFYKEKEIQLV